jgi:hypothetical protein
MQVLQTLAGMKEKLSKKFKYEPIRLISPNFLSSVNKEGRSEKFAAAFSFMFLILLYAVSVPACTTVRCP